MMQDQLIHHLMQYLPKSEQEHADLEQIKAYLVLFDDLLDRSNSMAHFANSAFVVNQNRDRVLMVHHNIYNAWSLTGGHADGEWDQLKVASREITEEAGIINFQPLTNDIFSIDILPVLGHFKKGQYVSAHLHLNLTYCFIADDREPLQFAPEENSGVKWIDIDSVVDISEEPHMKKQYAKLIERLKNMI